jgi:hypothetical protein
MVEKDPGSYIIIMGAEETRHYTIIIDIQWTAFMQVGWEIYFPGLLKPWVIRRNEIKQVNVKVYLQTVAEKTTAVTRIVVTFCCKFQVLATIGLR